MQRSSTHPAARLIIGDVSDGETVAAVVDGAEVVFHLAVARARASLRAPAARYRPGSTPPAP